MNLVLLSSMAERTRSIPSALMQAHLRGLGGPTGPTGHKHPLVSTRGDAEVTQKVTGRTRRVWAGGRLGQLLVCSDTPPPCPVAVKAGVPAGEPGYKDTRPFTPEKINDRGNGAEGVV